jgi:hypothetical protein
MVNKIEQALTTCWVPDRRYSILYERIRVVYVCWIDCPVADEQRQRARLVIVVWNGTEKIERVYALKVN